MSTANYYFFRLKQIWLKLETVAGTDPVPTAALNAVLTQNLQVTIDGDKLERVIDRVFFTANPFVLINRRCSVEFDFDMIGAATAGLTAPISPVLQACGHSETLVAATSSTFAPVSSAVKSATIYFYWFDNLININECRGSVSFDATINQWPKGHAKFTGLFAIPTTGTNTAGVTTSFQDPPAVTLLTMMLSVNSVVVNAKMFTFDEAANITIHEGSEYKDILMTNRAPTGTCRFYYPGQAVFDLFALASNHTKVPIVCSIDGGATKKVTITIPNAQFTMPKFVEIDGTVGMEAQFNALPSTAGNDEYTIAFT